MKTINILLFFLFLTGCTVIAKHELDNLYSSASVKNRVSHNPKGPDFFSKVKPILDSRCVVCHACYDAPCQLKLSSIEGIDRGATKKQVYIAERLFSTNPTRLFIDAKNTSEWRKKDFYPVLNERNSSANLVGSTMFQLLELKKKNSQLDTKILSSDYDFNLDRNQVCPQIEEFKAFSKKHPLWGMPYGFPGLSETEHQILKEWIESGSEYKPIKENYDNSSVMTWEKFFNGKSKKQLLMSRYIYEHVFLANLYFNDNQKLGYYRLVRSKTPPGEPIEIIPTRRPYDSPGGKFYYRLWQEQSTISAKIHMPYSLDQTRMSRWTELFLNKEYEVKKLPGYDSETAANPFKTFEAIPANSRYRFMLDEAEFTVMGFIKGPVCRGNKALNVIEDRFWVMFVNPDSPKVVDEDDFIKGQIENLRLPSVESSDSLILSTWLRYSSLQKKYLKAKEERLRKKFIGANAIGFDLIWDGDDINQNSALTIFRHNDSATVVKGFVGSTPKTAWLIGYSLLERIHYLLVAGFDIYGNVGHQLNSRLFMDFLRMEGEYNFLSLLPISERINERNYWYRDANKNILEYLSWNDKNSIQGISYKLKTKNAKADLLDNIKVYLGQSLNRDYDIENYNDTISTKLKKLVNQNGTWVPFMPNASILRVKSQNQNLAYSLIRDAGYSNVATPIKENDRRLPNEDKMTITKGIVGAYPNAYFDVSFDQLDQFIDLLKKMKSEADYTQILDLYAIRRSNQNFWAFSDWIHQHYTDSKPIEAGYLDYNRFENR